MKQKITYLCMLAAMSASMQAENGPDSLKQVKLNEVVVSAIRAGKNTPVAFNSFNEQEIKKENAAKNIPYLLQTLPSVVAFSEDGSGIGNTSLRIRGVDASRINVTLNGMPLNNPESQEVYWVDFPDVSNALQSMQVQRGVGTSSNGTASMGGSISLNTAGARPKAYGEINGSLGSYNTYLYTISGGTGILKNGLSLDGRYSQVRGDGYIRNGKVDHQGIYAALSYYADKDLFRFSYLHGTEHTGITWEGISPEQMALDRRYNPAGEYTDDNGNTQYYKNETDNYYSDILQATYSRFLSQKLTLNSSLSYNHGYGYYENYKTSRNFESYYGLADQTVDGVTYTESDAVHRKIMKNDFYVANASLSYKEGKLSLTGGGMASLYDGANYGHIVWVKYNQNIPNGYEWYRNDNKKYDYNLFGKASYQVSSQFSVFGDVQYRYVDYRLSGLDDDLVLIPSKNYYSFFNPKLGLSYQLDQNNRLGEVYASASVANREPLRADLKEGIKGGNTKQIKPERLFDYELGYRINKSNYAFNANFYYMDYKDQMVQTGKLNDVGYKLMENVGKSYRAGIELAGSYTPVKFVRLDANVTFSQNKIKDYTAYFDILDADWNTVGQNSEFHKKTNICFSPDVISSGIITLIPAEGVNISMIGKYVGKQYLDNTSDNVTSLPGYFFSNLVVGFTRKVKGLGEMELQVYVNNAFDKKYVANGWAGAYYYEGSSEKQYADAIGYYPQAERNFMTRLSLKF
jgi:iron complex outermembrane recepter protein